MKTLEAIQTKRAVRKFKAEPVPEATIHNIVDAGRRSQSSKNTQPWTFIVVQDRHRLERLSQCGKFADHMAEAAFAVVIVSETEREFDIGQAAAYLQLAAWDLGVSSCLVRFHYEEQAKAALNVPADKTMNIGISFGYAAEAPLPPKSAGRRKFDEVVRWESW
jgi:nitroreductase